MVDSVARQLCARVLSEKQLDLIETASKTFQQVTWQQRNSEFAKVGWKICTGCRSLSTLWFQRVQDFVRGVGRLRFLLGSSY